MVLAYHKQYILQAVGWLKRNTGGPRLRAKLTAGQAILLVGLLQLAGCDAVQIVENADTHVSVRYDGIMNGLDQATELAKRACAAHGRTAKLQKVYYEGLGAGERFAFFDCV
ncbi:MAG: hypothetical protein WA709_38650 [Stellaceae bacterium]